jgi:hypothetical protein
MLLTGNKDTNLSILERLNDTDLANLCQVNREAKKLCNDENFWRNRLLNKFRELGSLEELKKYKGDRTWKQYYIYLINFLENYYENSEESKKLVLEEKREDLLRLASIINGNNRDYLEKHYLNPEYLKTYNGLVDLNTIFDTINRYYFMGMNQDLQMKTYQIMLKDPNFKTNNRLNMNYIFEKNDEYLDLIFEDEKRINDKKTRNQIFGELINGLKNHKESKEYFDKLFYYMSDQEILDSIKYYIVNYLYDIDDRNNKIIFDELVKKGATKGQLEEFASSIKSIAVKNNKWKTIIGIKEYIRNLPETETEELDLLPEILSKLQSKRFSPRTYRKMLRLVSK